MAIGMREPATSKNILIVVTSLRRASGGAEAVAANLGTALSDQNNVTFLTFEDAVERLHFKGDFLTLGEQPGWATKVTRAWNRPKGIARVCRDRHIDLVISVMDNANIAAMGSRIVFGNRARIVLSVHTNPMRYRWTTNPAAESFGWEAMLTYPFWMRRLYPRADCVVAVTKTLEHQLRKRFGLKNVKTIHNLVHLDNVDELQHEELEPQHQELFETGPVFLTIGRLVEAKGQWHLLRAMESLREEFSTAKLVLVGAGPLEHDLVTMSKALGLQRNVFFLGRQANAYRFMKRADCFVLSSVFEGFGLVVVEALRIGMRVVSTDCGTREILSPGTDVTAALRYPHATPYGVLTPPIEAGFVAESIRKVPLTPAEAELVRAMRNAIRGSDTGATREARVRRAMDFDRSRIRLQWEELVAAIV